MPHLRSCLHLPTHLKVAIDPRTPPTTKPPLPAPSSWPPSPPQTTQGRARQGKAGQGRAGQNKRQENNKNQKRNQISVHIVGSILSAGTRQLVMSCCAFGNSLTLPLVFLLALLPGPAADRATGYLALFMMGWSPMLWSFGLQLLGRRMPASQPGTLHLATCLAWCDLIGFLV